MLKISEYSKKTKVPKNVDTDSPTASQLLLQLRVQLHSNCYLVIAMTDSISFDSILG